MQNDVYDYTSSTSVSHSSVLRKTYALLALSFIPCALGAYIAAATRFNLSSALGNRWLGLIALFAFFYGMIHLIERNRYSNLGAGLLMAFTFGMGALIAPLLQYSLHIRGGSQLVGLAAVMTAVVFTVMSLIARSNKVNTQGLGRFLGIGAIVLIIGIAANLFLQLPVLSLTITGAFVVFSSLMIMWQTRLIIEGGETSHISAALNIFISIYNLFSSLLQILLSFTSSDD